MDPESKLAESGSSSSTHLQIPVDSGPPSDLGLEKGELVTEQGSNGIPPRVQGWKVSELTPYLLLNAHLLT
jgi:hypothetical protein